MMLKFPDLGIEYQEFMVTVPVNAHRPKGKERLLKTLIEISELLKDPKIFFTYSLTFRAKQTHIHFNVLWWEYAPREYRTAKQRNLVG